MASAVSGRRVRYSRIESRACAIWSLSVESEIPISSLARWYDSPSILQSSKARRRCGQWSVFGCLMQQLHVFLCEHGFLHVQVVLGREVFNFVIELLFAVQAAEEIVHDVPAALKQVARKAGVDLRLRVALPDAREDFLHQFLRRVRVFDQREDIVIERFRVVAVEARKRLMAPFAQLREQYGFVYEWLDRQW